MKFLHLSDLHIKNDDDASENKRFKQLRNWIIEKYYDQNKPKIVITGDVTDNGEKDEFGKATTLLQEFVNNHFELIICPGNHDYGKNGIKFRDAAMERYFCSIEKDFLKCTGSAENMAALYPKVTPYRDEKVVFIGVDSTEGKMDNFGNFHILASGEVGETQRDQLRQELSKSEYSGYKKIVYLHNHPWEVIPGHGLDDSLDFLQTINGLVDVICFGHMHTPKFWESRAGMVALNAGKTTTPMRINKNNYLVYREVIIEGEQVHVGLVKMILD